MELMNESSVLSLQEMTTISIAISIWNQRISSLDPSTISEENDDIWSVFDPVDVISIPLPEKMIKVVQKCLDYLKDEMNEWLDHHSTFFPDMEKISILPSLKYVVWRSDGSIDYNATDKNLLDSCPEWQITDEMIE